MSVLIEFIFQDEINSTEIICSSTNEETSIQKNTNNIFDLWRTLVLRLTKHSFDVREAFGSAAINRVVELSFLDKFKCEFLCCFSQVFFL